MTRIAVLLVAFLAACSGDSFDPDAKYITVFVSKDGVVEGNGEEASLSQLEGALDAAAKDGAIVLFAREPAERDRGSNAMLVLQAIRERKLRIRTSGKRDFSDMVEPDGKLKP